ncbi:hypothetical protein [Campylobacter hyointestinalis]|uniref:hypothetical protein n=1 Tax=Campylobacter hyointestinalis TaxID=198 RepID=UPI0011AB90F8|nr:hypothetical protein [Campylobacter hyointestinalis]TWO22748.1 hypothetical protein YZ80_00420 [Campylobacter hyointestinalis]
MVLLVAEPESLKPPKTLRSIVPPVMFMVFEFAEPELLLPPKIQLFIVPLEMFTVFFVISSLLSE